MKVLFLLIKDVCIPCILYTLSIISAVEEFHITFILEGFPVAAYYPVESDYGLEYAAVVMRLVPKFLRQYDVAAFIANQVFIVGRNQQIIALPEPSRTAVVCDVKLSSFHFYLMDRVA